MRKNLVLIGMPGSGKSMLGPLAAALLGMPFRDADREIEAAAGLTIAEVFRIEGETGFRFRETEILERLGGESGLVIATGGGCVTREENDLHLRRNGVIILLERALSLLAAEGRPLLLQEDVYQLYEKRRAMYQRFADRTVQNDTEASIVAERIIKAYLEAEQNRLEAHNVRL